MIRTLLGLLLLFPVAGHAQSTIDSLHQRVNAAATDTARVWALHDLSYQFYTMGRPDSVMYYAMKELTLARQIRFSRGELRAMNDVGAAYLTAGNFNEAAKTVLAALKLSEERGDEYSRATALGNAAEIYSIQGEYKLAISYTMRSLALDQQRGDSAYLLYDYLNLGDYYEKANQLDSALMYQNRAYEAALKSTDGSWLPGTLYSLANIQMKLGNSDLATVYYRKSLAVGHLAPFSVSRSLNGLAQAFQKAGQNDSAKYYFIKAYAASLSSDPLFRIEAANSLANVYDGLNADSALKYLKISSAMRDSLFRQEKVRQSQNLIYAESFREAQNAEKKLAEEAERKNNIQLMGIAAFIPLFFGGVLLLSRRRVRPSAVEFMGLLGLLLLFEFISLFIHPYIAEWTHHRPVYMLLILVAIASLLVPAHHKLEKLVKEKLIRKGRQTAVNVEDSRSSHTLHSPSPLPPDPSTLPETQPSDHPDAQSEQAPHR